MRKSILFPLVLLLCIMLTGCKTAVNVEDKPVTVTITDTYHRSAWMQPIHAGKVTTFITHPAQYNVVVEYENETYTLDNQELYDQYKDKIGEQAPAILRITLYDDDTYDKDIIMDEDSSSDN